MYIDIRKFVPINNGQKKKKKKNENTFKIKIK